MALQTHVNFFTPLCHYLVNCGNKKLLEEASIEEKRDYEEDYILQREFSDVLKLLLSDARAWLYALEPN